MPIQRTGVCLRAFTHTIGALVCLCSICSTAAFRSAMPSSVTDDTHTAPGSACATSRAVCRPPSVLSPQLNDLPEADAPSLPTPIVSCLLLVLAASCAAVLACCVPSPSREPITGCWCCCLRTEASPLLLCVASCPLAAPPGMQRPRRRARSCKRGRIASATAGRCCALLHVLQQVLLGEHIQPGLVFEPRAQLRAYGPLRRHARAALACMQHDQASDGCQANTLFPLRGTFQWYPSLQELSY